MQELLGAVQKLRYLFNVPAVIDRQCGKISREAIAAGDRLLKAVKAKLLRKGGKIDYASLRKQGYSEATIARLKEI